MIWWSHEHMNLWPYDLMALWIYDISSWSLSFCAYHHFLFPLAGPFPVHLLSVYFTNLDKKLFIVNKIKAGILELNIAQSLKGFGILICDNTSFSCFLSFFLAAKTAIHIFQTAKETTDWERDLLKCLKVILLLKRIKKVWMHRAFILGCILCVQFVEIYQRIELQIIHRTIFHTFLSSKYLLFLF